MATPRVQPYRPVHGQAICLNVNPDNIYDAWCRTAAFIMKPGLVYARFSNVEYEAYSLALLEYVDKLSELSQDKICLDCIHTAMHWVAYYGQSVPE